MGPTPPEVDPFWSLFEGDGIQGIRCGLLDGARGIGHAFSTRSATGSDGRPQPFDLGHGTIREGPAIERRRRLCRFAGLGTGLPYPIRQVHGDGLLEPPADTRADDVEAVAPADGVILRRPAGGTASIAGVRTADCVPVLLADREGAAVAAVHAGWRGTAARIVPKAVGSLGALGIEPDRLIAAIGPAAGSCCYEVDRDVAAAVTSATPGGRESFPGRLDGEKPRLDLPLAIYRQLEAAGLAREAISRSPWCTVCREDLFFSHRREGEAAGRMMAVIGWIQGSP